MDSEKLCERIGDCLKENSFVSTDNLLAWKRLIQSPIKTLEERLESQNICSEFGQFKSLCEHLLISEKSQRYEHVYSALLKNNPKLIDDDLREQMSTKVNSDVCDSCKNAVQTSKDFWGNALESVRNILLRTCDYCSSQEKCRDYYNRRFNDIKSYLDNIDPDQFCQTIHLCSTLSESKEKDSESYDSNATCILCQRMMNMLADYIHQKSTEDEIEQGLQKVCDRMPATLRPQCHDLINNYGPAIISTLINDFDVSTVCQKLNLCTKEMKVELSTLDKANSALCGVCDYISTYLNFAVKPDSSEKTIQRALSTVCTHLSTERIPHCEKLVQLFRPNIRKLKENDLCKQLTICQTPMKELKPAIDLDRLPAKQDDELQENVLKNLDATPQCMLCHYVVSYLDAILKNNKSEAAVQAALAKVCTILPRKERAQCDVFVTNYGPVLADLISELADPSLVCRYLGMCQVISSQDAKPIVYTSHRHAHISV